MKTFTKTALTIITVAFLSTTAFANDDALNAAQERVDAIAIQLESMGAEVDKNVDLNSTATPLEQEAALNAKYEELQQQLASIQVQSSEQS